MRRSRGELTIAGEAIAAFRVASCKRIISFGFDESTKFGLGMLATNTQIEPHDAPGTSIDVLLRGVTLTAGGTAKKIAASIETKLFSHARALLRGWKQTHEKRFGAGSWAAAGAPEAESIGLHRLSENTVLMSDTCNAARATKRLLAEMAEAAGRQELGEAWESMSEGERELRCKAHLGDCQQHLRNIIINNMTLKSTQVLKLKLEDDLADLAPFERASVDGNDLIRAVFKELHGGGEYAKGKGREFEAWRKEKYPSALWLPLERVHGTRQDIAFDGAEPIFWNRHAMLEFLNGLLLPGAENKLESFLWRSLACNEMTAHLRACTLYKNILSSPMRWLAGKASKSLTDWSIVESSKVLELAEAALEAIAEDGHNLFDPSFDPFAAVAAKQPQFAAWRAEELARVVKAHDGTKHLRTRVLAEARSPSGEGNIQATEMTVQLAEEMAGAGLAAMRDARRAIADKLSSQDGVNAPGKCAAVHEVTRGAHVMNDHVESIFSGADHVVRTCASIM